MPSVEKHLHVPQILKPTCNLSLSPPFSLSPCPTFLSSFHHHLSLWLHCPNLTSSLPHPSVTLTFSLSFFLSLSLPLSQCHAQITCLPAAPALTLPALRRACVFSFLVYLDLSICSPLLLVLSLTFSSSLYLSLTCALPFPLHISFSFWPLISPLSASLVL